MAQEKIRLLRPNLRSANSRTAALIFWVTSESLTILASFTSIVTWGDTDSPIPFAWLDAAESWICLDGVSRKPELLVRSESLGISIPLLAAAGDAKARVG